MTETLPLWLEILAALLLVLGGVFVLVGALGMLRFPDFYMRLHAPTKATTLGVGGLLLASMLVASTGMLHSVISVVRISAPEVGMIIVLP